jgi:hypothetical protein
LPGHWQFTAPVTTLFDWTAHDGVIREVAPGWSFDPTIK